MAQSDENGTGNVADDKCDNEEKGDEKLSSNAVTDQQQQNNKNGKNSNNKMIKKNAKGEKLDSQTSEEVGEVEA